MPPRRTLIPFPPLPQPSAGQPPGAPPAPEQIGPPPIEVHFPEASQVIQRVIQANPRSVAPFTNPQPFPWLTPDAVGIQGINTLDAPATIAVAINVQPSIASSLLCPVVEFDVGPGECRCPNVDPSAGDPWGPQLQFTVTPLAPPTGGSLEVWVVRKGA